MITQTYIFEAAVRNHAAMLSNKRYNRAIGRPLFHWYFSYLVGRGWLASFIEYCYRNKV